MLQLGGAAASAGQRKRNILRLMHSHTSFKPLFIAFVLACAFFLSAQARETYAVTGGDYLIEWKGRFTDEQKYRLQDWLSALDPAISTLHGAWPRPQIRIEFVPIDAVSRASSNTSISPVPFARVIRLRPEGILFYVDPNRSLDEFVADWTAYHELSHLFIPFPGQADIWFSEGIASYYQNILQMRSGALSPEQARERLRAGFERGAKNNQDADLTLGQLSGDMFERGAFMRVYWTGALYFLEADIELRSRSNQAGPARTMDEVLQLFGECCLQAGRSMRGSTIAAEFDRLAETELFVPLFQKYAATRAIPEYEDLLSSSTADQIFSQP